jgi:hypothetical protein
MAAAVKLSGYTTIQHRLTDTAAKGRPFLPLMRFSQSLQKSLNRSGASAV